MKDLFKKDQKESTFQRKLLKELRKIPNSIWFVKEARSIRGLPDLYGSVNGRFVVLEVKKSEEESRKSTGHICLQRKTIADVQSKKGYGSFVYPENMKYVIEELTLLSKAA